MKEIEGRLNSFLGFIRKSFASINFMYFPVSSATLMAFTGCKANTCENNRHNYYNYFFHFLRINFDFLGLIECKYSIFINHNIINE